MQCIPGGRQHCRPAPAGPLTWPSLLGTTPARASKAAPSTPTDLKPMDLRTRSAGMVSCSPGERWGKGAGSSTARVSSGLGRSMRGAAPPRRAGSRCSRQRMRSQRPRSRTRAHGALVAALPRRLQPRALQLDAHRAPVAPLHLHRAAQEVDVQALGPAGGGWVGRAGRRRCREQCAQACCATAPRPSRMLSVPGRLRLPGTPRRTLPWAPAALSRGCQTRASSCASPSSPPRTRGPPQRRRGPAPPVVRVGSE